MDAVYWHIMLSEKSLKDKSSISMLEQKTSQISETETEKTRQISVCWNRKKLVKYQQTVTDRKKLDSFKTWSCRPNSRMISSVPFGRVRLHLRCLALAACRILILSKEMAEPRIPSKPWRHFRSMKTIFFLIQTFCSLFFWNACKFS